MTNICILVYCSWWSWWPSGGRCDALGCNDEAVGPGAGAEDGETLGSEEELLVSPVNGASLGEADGATLGSVLASFLVPVVAFVLLGLHHDGATVGP